MVRPVGHGRPKSALVLGDRGGLERGIGNVEPTEDGELLEREPLVGLDLLTDDVICPAYRHVLAKIHAYPWCLSSDAK